MDDPQIEKIHTPPPQALHLSLLPIPVLKPSFRRAHGNFPTLPLNAAGKEGATMAIAFPFSIKCSVLPVRLRPPCILGTNINAVPTVNAPFLYYLCFPSRMATAFTGQLRTHA